MATPAAFMSYWEQEYLGVMNGVKGVSKTAKPTRIDNITDKSKMGLVARTLLTALKVTVSVVVLYQGVCMFRPDLDPDLFYFFDAKFRGVYGKEIQDFVTNVLGSSYKIKPLSIKRTIGIYEIAFVILLWVGNGAFFGGQFSLDLISVTHYMLSWHLHNIAFLSVYSI